MATITLKRTGDKMPIVGLGLWKIPRPQCADTVYNALKAGYRLLDGAGDYGNEKEAGEGLARAIKDGIVKREEVFVTTKLWNTYHKKERVHELVKFQLGLWGIDYFDLFLIHFPVALQDVAIKDKYPPEWWGLDGNVHPTNIPIRETWEGMEEICELGHAKNIGVSNFQGSILIDVLRYARIPPVVNQVELHPYLSQKKLVALCKELGVAVTAYSSLGPQGYYELGVDTGHPSLLKHDVVTSIAQASGKTPAQVILRWAVQQDIAVIPKSNSHERLVSNLEVTSFDLTPEQVQQIDGLNINLRLNDPQDIHPGLGVFA